MQPTDQQKSQPTENPKVRNAAEKIAARYHERNVLIRQAGGIPQPIEDSTDAAVILAVDYLKHHGLI